jgi:hypothetical protein
MDQSDQNSEMPLKKVSTINDFAESNQKHGIWPSTSATLWALKAGAPANGFGNGVFFSVNRRVLVDIERFWAAVAKLQEISKK